MAALGASPLVIAAHSLMDSTTKTDQDLKVYIFSKHLQFLDYKDMSEAAKEMGFDGDDLTFRPKGHVLPENVEEYLPKATEAMKSFGLLTNLLTSAVMDANNPVDRKVLDVVSQTGYKFLKDGLVYVCSGSRYKGEFC